MRVAWAGFEEGDLGSETQSTLFWLWLRADPSVSPPEDGQPQPHLWGRGGVVCRWGAFGKPLAQCSPGFCPSCPLHPGLPSPHPNSHRLPGGLERKGRHTSLIKIFDD